MKISIPETALIALVGASSSGKSTFAKKHFAATQVLSSDSFRGMVCDDENDQSVSEDAFELLYQVAGKRLDHAKLTVIDATNLRREDRAGLLSIAKDHDVHAAAIVLDVPEKDILERNERRTDRQLSPRVIHSQYQRLKDTIRALKKEGFRFVYVLDGQDEVDNCEIVYNKLWNDKRDEHGAFDVIGDVHGCADELRELLEKLGYDEPGDRNDGVSGFRHPDGRRAIFVGDLTDRGPKNMEVLRIVMDMVDSGTAFCVPGNHDNKLERYLNRHNVQISHGMEKTVAELEHEDDEFKMRVRSFLSGLVSHYVFDDGKLVVAHAGIKESYIGRASNRVREFCLYGDTTGETDDLGLPVRLDWAKEYRGDAAIVYGHVPTSHVMNVNNTFCVDTGCVFGGSLSAFRYPEREVVSVSAHAQYCVPVRPLPESNRTDGIIDASDVTGKLYIETRLMPAVTIPEDKSAKAFELMSRFAVDPRWLIYLPPTMSPCETAKEEEYLEFPAEAFSYYRQNGINKVVCEKKHMGSRAVIVLCRSAEAAKKRFGIDGDRGIIYTRTGRRFFADRKVETYLLDKMDEILSESGFWADFDTDWICVDAELLPWSEKAKDLLRTQYGPVGRAGRESLAAAKAALREALKYDQDSVQEMPEGASGANADIKGLLEKYQEKEQAISGYVDAYRRYCWHVNDVSDIKIAPFHILATEGYVHSNKDHIWQMETIKKYVCGKNDLFVATEYTVVDVNDEVDIKKGTNWWITFTASGGEGMVVKPLSFITMGNHGLIQPAVKCRGREYLRIIYGPEYLTEEHLPRLKKRSLSTKRKLALREFALGMESLERFVREDPLYRVHECVFGVLAMECEEVDPRL